MTEYGLDTYYIASYQSSWFITPYIMIRVSTMFLVIIVCIALIVNIVDPQIICRLEQRIENKWNEFREWIRYKLRLNGE